MHAFHAGLNGKRGAHALLFFICHIMQELTMDAFLEEFDPEVRPKIKEAIARYEGVTHVVMARCEDMWSSMRGHKTAMVVGPNNTYKTLEDCEGKWLGDLPSQRQHFVKYARVGS